MTSLPQSITLDWIAFEVGRGVFMKLIELTCRVKGKILQPSGVFTMVDDEDYERINKYKWHISKRRSTSYAHSFAGGHKHISLQRFIFNNPLSKKIDHIDGDGLNNQKYNLRICSHSENVRNSKKRNNKKQTSIYKGVTWDKTRNRYRARIIFNYKEIF